MNFVVLKFSLVKTTIFEVNRPSTMLLSYLPLSIILLTIRPLDYSNSIGLIIFPLTFVPGAICVLENSFSMCFV